MKKEIKMPAGGQTTDVSTIGSWLVKKGDRVNRGDALLEVETDKATLTVESFAKGTVLEILAQEGDKVAAGTVIAYIGDEEESLQHEEVKEAEDYRPVARIKAMPNAKKLAGERHISLEKVAEQSGRDIVKRSDVEAYLGQNQAEKRPITSMRRTIARRMLESVQTIPAFQAAVEIDMEACTVLRNTANEGRKEHKISYHDILFKCTAAAIRKYPYINASFSEEGIIVHEDVNIGLAVSVTEGLVVPVVRAVDEKQISEIAAQNKENIAKARSGKLTSQEMSGGTITISNLGMYPVTQFSAIINPPESCILAAAAIEEKPIFVDGQWEMAHKMCLTGSFDHRVVDGAYAAQFLAELKRIMENPAFALL